MSEPLVHYVVVRRDLPPLRKIIDVGHAAGESFFLLGQEMHEGGHEVTFDPKRTVLILRGARNEAKLLKLEKQLIEKGIAHVAVREPDEPWNNQLMAIGLCPGGRGLSQYVNDFQNLNQAEPY